ncbi:MAG: tetratricopeptide repeat protein [Thermodesulfobacteriota bacterium]
MLPPPATGARKEHSAGLMLLILFCFGLAIYSNSLTGLFLFDDIQNIVGNPSIRKLWPPWDALVGSRISEISGRPLANLSFAVNYAISGLDSWSYHALNLLFHLLATGCLFGIARRALRSPTFQGRYEGNATLIAFFLSLLWLAHPLSTQAVTYITQRIESMMGLCLLASLYFSIRGWEDGNRKLWHTLAVAVFFAGAATKEVMVVAPLLILLYDVIFEGKTPADALRRSSFLYYGLLAGVVFLLALVLRGDTWEKAFAGGPEKEFGKSTFQYLMNQPNAIATYLKLTVWPRKLCINYEWSEVPLWYSLLAGAIILCLVGYTGWLIRWKRPGGFVGAWFFLILAPTSSVLPLWCDIEEHRMYLPLAAPIALFTLATFRAGKALPPRLARTAVILFLSLVGSVLGYATYERNFDYANSLTIWTDAIQKRPWSYSAKWQLGKVYVNYRMYKEAYEILLPLTKCENIENPTLINTLGLVLRELERPKEAEEMFRSSITTWPERDETAYCNLGGLLLDEGRPAEAVPYLSVAVRLNPQYPKFRRFLGEALAGCGRYEEAAEQFRKAIELAGADPESQAFLDQIQAIMDGGKKDGGAAPKGQN